MSNTFIYTSTMHVIECAACGMLFAVPEDFEDRRREDHVSFVCPRGHSNYYSQDSEADKLRKQLAAERGKSANLQLEILAAQAEARRQARRARRGVCPCCNRQFVQMARHMKSKHPEYREG